MTPRWGSPLARLTRSALLGPLTLGLLIIILLTSAAAPAAHADGIATLESHRGNRLLEMTVRWTENRLRLDIPSRPADYLLRRDDAAYLVSDLNNRLVVINLTNLRRRSAQRGAESSAPSRQSFDLKVLEPLHKQEAVGGIQGEVYRLQWTDGRGESHEERLVVSDHPLVAELMAGMQAYYRALSDRPDPIINALVKRELGMLRFAGRFRLVSISGDTPDAGLFELPGGSRVMEAFEAPASSP